MNSSNFLNLNWKDLGKGLLVAVITTFVAALYQSFSGTNVHFPTLAELKADGLVALAAGVSYLLKNLLTNSSGQALTTEK